MKGSFRPFFRSFYISLTVIFCFIMFIYGTSLAYKAIRQTMFAEYTNAIEISDNKIRIFDFEFKKPGFF